MMALSKLITVLPFSPSTSGVSAGKFTQTVNHLHFTTFGHASQTTGQLSDDFSFRADLVNVSFRFAENDAVFGQRFRFFDNFATCSSALEGYNPRSDKHHRGCCNVLR